MLGGRFPGGKLAGAGAAVPSKKRLAAASTVRLSRNKFRSSSSSGSSPTMARKDATSAALAMEYYDAPACRGGVRSAEKDGSPVEISVRRRAREVGGLRAGALWDGDGAPRR